MAICGPVLPVGTGMSGRGAGEGVIMVVAR
jgi:hypothetical protein